MKISNLIGKRIESEDRKKCGVIMAISCNKNAIDGYICFDESENEFFAQAQGARVSKDRVTFKTLGQKGKDSLKLRLGVPAFTYEGKYLGSVSDYSAVQNKLCAVFIGNKKYSAENIGVADAVIIKPSPQKLQAEIAAKDMFLGVLCGN